MPSLRDQMDGEPLRRKRDEDSSVGEKVVLLDSTELPTAHVWKDDADIRLGILSFVR